VHLFVSSSGVTFLRAPRGWGERLPAYLVVCGAGRCRPEDSWALAVMGACAWGHVATARHLAGEHFLIRHILKAPKASIREVMDELHLSGLNPY
jgi:hypothetical protein